MTKSKSEHEKKAKAYTELAYTEIEGVVRDHMDDNGHICRYKMMGTTHGFYDKVFSVPYWQEDDTGIMTEKARNAVCNKNKFGEKIKTTKDHFITPQTIARMIIENWEDFEGGLGSAGFLLFNEIFQYCRKTILVTNSENTQLSNFTCNKDGIFYLQMGFMERYKHLFDYVFIGNGTKRMSTDYLEEMLDIPQYILEKEKDYLRLPKVA